MGYVFTIEDARQWDAWCERPANRFAMDLEHDLMMDMIQPMRLDTVLDIGCGGGITTSLLVRKGMNVTGLDPSGPALDIASKKVGHRADLHGGVAEDLPFDDNSFHYVCLFKTLEFVDNPRKALEEACRVAKYRVFVGVVNPCSFRGGGLRIRRLFGRTVYRHARFLSLWELKGMIRGIAGDVPLQWRTLGQLPSRPGRITRYMERFPYVQKCPFGAFVGISVTLFPRFRTRPLELKTRPKPSTGAVVAGLVGSVRREKRWK